MVRFRINLRCSLLAISEITSIVDFDEKYAQEIRRIRNAVFTAEQGILESIDFDGQDRDAAHVLVQHAGVYAATGRMLPDGHIGRLAVLSEYRRRGLGEKALQALVEHARSAGLQWVYLGAQIQVVGFYEKLGFTPCGGPFFEAGIQHIQMQLFL